MAIGADPLSEDFERYQRLIQYDSALLADIAAGRTVYRFRPEEIALIQARREETQVRIAAIEAARTAPAKAKPSEYAQPPN